MKKILIVLSLVLLTTSCDDVLDISPKDRIVDDAVWVDENLVRAYHTSLYNSLPHGFRINMQSKTTDEAYCTKSNGASIIAYGTITPDNLGSISVTDWTGGCNLYIWDSAFQNIRKINVFLEKCKKVHWQWMIKIDLLQKVSFYVLIFILCLLSDMEKLLL